MSDFKNYRLCRKITRLPFQRSLRAFLIRTIWKMLLSLINYSGGGCPIKNIEARLGGHLIQHKPVKKIYCENNFSSAITLLFCTDGFEMEQL